MVAASIMKGSPAVQTVDLRRISKCESDVHVGVDTAFFSGRPAAERGSRGTPFVYSTRRLENAIVLHQRAPRGETIPCHHTLCL